MKKVLLLDVDEVICFSGYIDALNDYLKTDYDIDYFKSYLVVEDIFTDEQEKKEFLNFVAKRNLYEKPRMLPNAVKVIEKLSKKYNIYICSAYANEMNKTFCGEQLRDKYYFLLKTLPFIDPTHYIFASDKLMFNADIRIDDRIGNLGNAKINILFPSYHNTDIPDKILEEKNIIRAGKDYKNGWDEIEKILL